METETSRLGRLAVARGLVDPKDLERCLELQEKSSPPRFLGEVLVEQGLLKESALKHLLTAQHRAQGEHLYSSKETAERLQEGSLPEFLGALLQIGGQELYLSSGARPQVRRNGRLRSIRPEPLTADHCRELLSSFLGAEEFERLLRERSLECVHEARGLGRFRASLVAHSRGLAGTFAAIPSVVPKVEELGLPEVFHELRKLPHGLVLVTGPRASGKTTTLSAVVEQLNETRRLHLITLEQPVEFLHPSRGCLISQREIGRHVPDWHTALVSSLREDPDVIVVGRLEGVDSVATALAAAEAGSLVLGAMQTPGARETLLRIMEAYAGDDPQQVRSMLSATLRFVFSQQLVPSLDGERLHLACEVLRCTPAVASMIREGRTHRIEDVMQTSREQGMITLDGALIQLVKAGLISVGEATSRARQQSLILEAAK